MGNSSNTKNDNNLDLNYTFTSHDEEKAPLSSYIEKNNDNSGEKLKNFDCIIEINNFTNAETKATSKFNKKKKIIKKKKKYSTENLKRKIKTVVFDLIKNFSNKRINEIYNGDIGNGFNIKKLLKINYSQIQKMSANHNKLLLDKTIKDIFSDDISKKYTDYPSFHNKDLINRLLNEEDDEKRYRIEIIISSGANKDPKLSDNEHMLSVNPWVVVNDHLTITDINKYFNFALK